MTDARAPAPAAGIHRPPASPPPAPPAAPRRAPTIARRVHGAARGPAPRVTAPPRHHATPGGDDGPATSLAPGDLAAARRFGAGDELKLEKAFDVAWRFLGHRDRTEAEVRRTSSPSASTRGCRGGRRGAARGRLRRRRGVRPPLRRGSPQPRPVGRRSHRAPAEGARRRPAADPGRGHAGEHDELAAACELLERRFPHPPETPRDLERALGFLVRKGYELELAL